MLIAYNNNPVNAQQGTRAVTLGNVTTAGFDLISGSTALVAGTTYQYSYLAFEPGT